MSAIVVANAVPAEQVAEIRRIMADGPFVSGKDTAVGGAAVVKNNLQLAPESPASKKAVGLLLKALDANPAFRDATWPQAVMTPMFARYEPGMEYGHHIDGAFMGEPPNTIRCDIAVTVCLNDGSSYEGGDLVIDAAGVPTYWKGSAGDALVYPADTMHGVAPVRSGVRDVAIFWIQSAVRDTARRRILHDLRRALDALDRSPTPTPEIDAIRRSYFNLLRMWV